jgi:hypothetical protein
LEVVVADQLAEVEEKLAEVEVGLVEEIFSMVAQRRQCYRLL